MCNRQRQTRQFVKMLQRQVRRYWISAVFIRPVSDFYQDFEEPEPPRGYQSDDGAAVRHQCLRHQPRGPLGLLPPGLCASHHLCIQSMSDPEPQNDHLCVPSREDPASRRKPSSVASSIVSHPFSTRQTTAAGW